MEINTVPLTTASCHTHTHPDGSVHPAITHAVVYTDAAGNDNPTTHTQN